ncbi:hypothetical protein HYS95_02960 [Candidatus Daviesbacteria bacterium]|nr:hypothetical protein [Candidatus Daviesbacteria bacterium]
MSKVNLLIKFSPLILSAVMVVYILFGLKLLPPRLPLFYSLPWGEGQLATHSQFLVIPSSIILITLLNLILSWQLHSSQTFFKKILNITSIIVSIILTTAFIKIILNFI